jgi:ribulose-5-phosphate 4-epimerase/fuculose-1-phosphate aldolase
MNFSVFSTTKNQRLTRYANLIAKTFERNGHVQTHAHPLKFILNVTDIDDPKHYRRKSFDEFVVTLTSLEHDVEDVKSTCFITLVKTLSNLVLCLSPENGDTAPDLYYITPEAGFVKIPFEPDRVYRCMLPIVGSTFVLKNKINTDLPVGRFDFPELNSLIDYAHLLGKIGHLPIPFPIEDYIDETRLRHLYRLYEIKGLSYGNLSVRNVSYQHSGTSFWMTARGSDKAHLQQVGKDILLVTGYNKHEEQMVVSVPADFDQRIRVSVDAIEHYLIYTKFPSVGAIVHIHSWMEGIRCSTQNFPCGTYELAQSVVDLLDQEANPAQAVVGLKNHGITITGIGPEEIFARIKGKVQTRVPMFE